MMIINDIISIEGGAAPRYKMITPRLTSAHMLPPTKVAIAPVWLGVKFFGNFYSLLLIFNILCSYVVIKN
jgi:hypothetical protein